MNSNEQKKAAGKPYLQKLKDLGMGLSMDRVLGDRVLIMPIVPFTEMDKVEKAGLLFIPETAREQNAPPPTTGQVVMIGPDVPKEAWYEGIRVEGRVKIREMNPAANVADLRRVELPILTPGEIVMFSRYAGMDIMLDKVALKLLHFNEIVCVLKAEDPDAIELVEDNHA